MTSSKISKESILLLQRLARRLQTHPGFMASVLAQFQSTEKLSDEAMRLRLKVSDHGLARIALSFRPDSSEESFSNDVRTIADYASADAGELAAIIRRVEIIEHLLEQNLDPTEDVAQRNQLAVSRGLFAATRDRFIPDTSNEEGAEIDDEANE